MISAGVDGSMFSPNVGFAMSGSQIPMAGRLSSSRSDVTGEDTIR